MNEKQGSSSEALEPDDIAASPRLTIEEWQQLSHAIPRQALTGEPNVVYVRARFALGLMTGLLLGAGGYIAVAVYALGQF